MEVPTLLDLAKVRTSITIWTKLLKENKMFEMCSSKYYRPVFIDDSIEEARELALAILGSKIIIEATNFCDMLDRIGFQVLKHVREFCVCSEDVLGLYWDWKFHPTGFINGIEIVEPVEDLEIKKHLFAISCELCDVPNIEKLWSELQIIFINAEVHKLKKPRQIEAIWEQLELDYKSIGMYQKYWTLFLKYGAGGLKRHKEYSNLEMGLSSSFIGNKSALEFFKARVIDCPVENLPELECMVTELLLPLPRPCALPLSVKRLEQRPWMLNEFHIDFECLASYVMTLILKNATKEMIKGWQEEATYLHSAHGSTIVTLLSVETLTCMASLLSVETLSSTILSWSKATAWKNELKRVVLTEWVYSVSISRALELYKLLGVGEDDLKKKIESFKVSKHFTSKRPRAKLKQIEQEWLDANVRLAGGMSHEDS